MICTGCGAKLATHAEFCDLCGTPVSLSITESQTVLPSLEEATEILKPHFCTACGAENKVGANFCFHCGADLRKQEHAAPKSTSALPTQGDATKVNVRNQVFKVIGVGALAVVVLFAISLWSKENIKPTPKPVQAAKNTVAPAQEIPLNAELSKKVKPFVDKIAQLKGNEKQKAQLELATLFLQNQRQDKAGSIQENVAQSVNTAEAWAIAGHSYYDWMMKQPEGDPNKAAYAQKAVAAYEKSLSIQENPDVRTDMAVAYLNDPLNPMKAIQNTNLVLEKNPNHVQANFNKAFMLLQVGRTAQAKEFFQKVKTLTPPTEEAHKRADMMLKEIK